MEENQKYQLEVSYKSLLSSFHFSHINCTIENNMGSIQTNLPVEETNGSKTHLNGAIQSNGTSEITPVNLTPDSGSDFELAGMWDDVPVAICGMAVRLPGGLTSPQDFWDFLISKGDARGRVPNSRYNISAYHSTSGRPGTIATEYGYFLDESVKLGSLDASRFSLSRAELEFAGPEQRLMLEVVREALDDAGEVDFRVRSPFLLSDMKMLTTPNTG